MIEWWGKRYQYASDTTLLFWAPNHTLPGWIATAWLLSQDLRRMSIQRAVLFVVLAPIWAPLTALGIAPLVATAIGHRLWIDRDSGPVRDVFDFRVVVVSLVCIAMIFPYLVAGSGEVPIGYLSDIRWVGETAVARVIEFAIVEFAGLALLLVIREPRDPLLWVAIVVLLMLPFYYFGPYNDLVMRTSIPALMLIAIRMGRWLSTPVAPRELPFTRTLAIVLLAIGAVTPIMEFSRAFMESPWPMNVRSSVADVTRGAHYLTPADQPWLERFLRPSSVH